MFGGHFSTVLKLDQTLKFGDQISSKKTYYESVAFGWMDYILKK